MREENIKSILLSEESLDELINRRMEADIERRKQEREAERARGNCEIEDIKQLSAKEILSKEATYLVYTKDSGEETYLNGIQINGILGLECEIRRKLTSGEISGFSTGGYHAKFVKYKK